MLPERVIAGRLIQSSIVGFTFACVPQSFASLHLGALIRANVTANLTVFGLIANIAWPGDGMIAQLAHSPLVDEAVISDNQFQRGGGPVLQAIHLGYRDQDAIIHQALPSQIASSLAEIDLCAPAELVAFSNISFAYLRLILLAADQILLPDLLAAHLQQASEAHRAIGNQAWASLAARRLASLLRQDYDQTLNIFEAISQRVSPTQFHTTKGIP